MNGSHPLFPSSAALTVLPAFAYLRPDHFGPGFEEAMRDHREEPRGLEVPA